MCKIDRRMLLGSAVALAGTRLFAANTDQAVPHSYQNGKDLCGLLVETANRFVASLDPPQQIKATFQFDDDERMNWHYIPKERKGLPLREMTPYQKLLACALMSAGLSQKGNIKALTIMSLDDVLRRIENDNGERRNPEKYYFSIFGTPAATGSWGYRIEGHHVSQNYTIVDGEVVDGPSFFGANPAQVLQGARKGLRALPEEDDLGVKVIQSLDASQRKIAIVEPNAYKEILTAASRKAALEGQPSGLPASKMNAQQFDALRALLDEYATNVPLQLMQRRRDQISKSGRNILLAWSGGIDAGDPRYYRIQSSAFMVEFDKTQDNANHIHAVWRDVEGDFGNDLLKQHYETGPHSH